MGAFGPTRREVLRLGAAGLVLPSTTWAGVETSGGELAFRLTETVGLRRFGFPVHLILPEPRSGVHFRLERGGRAVPAQFRAVDGPDGGPAVALDFVASPGPLEAEPYVVRYGDDLEPGPEPKQRLRVEPVEGLFRITNGPNLHFDVPADLLGFLGAVGGRLPYLGPRSEGLLVFDRDGNPHRVGGPGPGGAGPRSAVVRQGPLAVSIRFDSAVELGGGPPLDWSATLTVPSSKSWVETTWTVDDPAGLVGGLGVDLNLAVGEGPTLVDLGAGPGVYTRLKAGERIEVEAGGAPGLAAARGGWAVRHGTVDAVEPLALPPFHGATPAEGWAHVMDASRCTALAVDGFGRMARDRIEVEADGRVRLRRDFAAPGAEGAAGPKVWTFWFHFVPMPVQVGAATSPRAMLNPLRIDWDGPSA